MHLSSCSTESLLSYLIVLTPANRFSLFMLLWRSVFSTNTESLQQPRDISLPQAGAVHPISAQDNSLGTVQLRVATQDSCAGLQDLA